MANRSWREVSSKVDDLRSETIDGIAEIILNLEDEVERLKGEVENAHDQLAEAGGLA